jgi:hypothetical protein
MYEGGEISLSGLEDATDTGRQVVAELGWADPEVLEIDDVEVGALANGDGPTIGEAVEVGIPAAQLVHEQLDGKVFSLGPVTGPVGQVDGPPVPPTMVPPLITTSSMSRSSPLVWPHGLASELRAGTPHDPTTRWQRPIDLLLIAPARMWCSGGDASGPQARRQFFGGA